MTDKYSMGNFGYAIFYAIVAFGSILVGLINSNLSATQIVSFIFYYMLQTIIIRELVKNKSISRKAYAMLQIILAPVACRMFCLALDDTRPFLIFMYIQAALTLLFLDKFLNKFQNIISVVWIILMVFIKNSLVASERPSQAQYISTAISLIIISKLFNYMIDRIIIQTRLSMEREQSLDDLSKVIELKCDEARNATRSKSDFLANMSHEIRTPINAIIGMNEMILRESKDSQILEYATTVEGSSKMLLSLINDILDFSKIESNKMDIIRVKYHLSSLLNDLLGMLLPKAKDKDLKLELKVSEDVPNYLYGDEIRVRQVLTNLITNAIKYTDTGKITLSISHVMLNENTSEISFSVKDTGRGIREKDLPHLFSSFQRVDQHKNRNIEGTGLGLAISYQLAQMMCGDIKVESTYGVGSTFTLVLPQSVMSDEAIGDFEKQFNRRNVEHKVYKESFRAPEANVLVVDDNEVNLKVIKNLLKLTGINVDTATSGMECIKLLGDKHYHLLFLDHMMPEMDGMETLEEIKMQHLDVDMPIIALTANATSGAREMYIDYGFQDYLSKPVMAASLEKALCKWLPSELVEYTADNLLDSMPKSQEVDDEKQEAPLFNKRTALMYCGGSMEMYKEILSCYIEQGEKHIKSLEKYFEEENWKNYCIVAHSLKSTSLTIGAEGFSELAKSQEMFIKENHISEATSNHEKFIDTYRSILDTAKGMI